MRDAAQPPAGMPFRETALQVTVGPGAFRQRTRSSSIPLSYSGIRCLPQAPNGVGALVLAGSSGRVDADRARLVAGLGAITASIRWFGGAGQQPAPFEVPIELFQHQIDALAADCDQVIVIGTSFGAEAALVVASHIPEVHAVVAFAPSDVVWAGVRPDGTQTSHWTLDGIPLPFVPFDEAWEPNTDPPSFADLYRRSRAIAPERAQAAAIAVERIPTVVLVAGGDDRVWPSVDHAGAIVTRRAAHGLTTTVISHPLAGHRAVLPDEPVVTGGMTMARGGAPEADAALGSLAWPAIVDLIAR